MIARLQKVKDIRKDSNKLELQEYMCREQTENISSSKRYGKPIGSNKGIMNLLLNMYPLLKFMPEIYGS